MNRGRVVLTAVVLAIGPVPAADVHSWYPGEYCSNHDCIPADALQVDLNGDMIVMVGKLRIWILRGFPEPLQLSAI